MPEIHEVPILEPGGAVGRGILEAWEEAPDDGDRVLLRLRFGDAEWTSRADDFFTALASLRTDFESDGSRLLIYGASKDVYPSPMIRSMGSGSKAYRLKPGEQAKTADLVSIFGTGSDVLAASVAEQEAFYAAWLASLRNRS